jgi:hypothetical protein
MQLRATAATSAAAAVIVSSGSSYSLLYIILFCMGIKRNISWFFSWFSVSCIYSRSRLLLSGVRILLTSLKNFFVKKLRSWFIFIFLITKSNWLPIFLSRISTSAMKIRFMDLHNYISYISFLNYKTKQYYTTRNNILNFLVIHTNKLYAGTNIYS